ncbi:MAG: hypothetical protein GX159_01980 [Flavobacteriaceae bacterium]|jgi:DNA-binding CsgD family transcriptional regulator|nr:hypothetical protein [Flavobacteriaceae bacterium]
MEKIKKLVEIWQKIPTTVNEELNISEKEILEKFLDAFHIGEYFYVIFNTQKAEMEYVSPQSFHLIGCKPEDFTLQHMMENVHPEDSPYYLNYERTAVEFFTQLDPSDFFNYKFSYDYRISTSSGEYKRVMQQVIPLFYFPDGGARTLGIFTDISHLGIQGIPKLSFIGMNGAPSFYNYHERNGFKKAEALLSRRERKVLSEVIQGHSSSEIAQKLNLSIYTIQTHRKNILKKSGCSNLTELISKSIREGWV